MKQFFTLILMAMCSVVAFADEVVYDFVTSQLPKSWSASVDPIGFETTNLSRGAQFNASNGNATLTLAGVKNATKVVVTCSTNIADKNILGVSVAESQWGSEVLAKENNVEKTFVGDAASGNLQLNLTVAEKSLYIGKVVVTCDGVEGGDTGDTGNQGDTDKLDPTYSYGEPTILIPNGDIMSNAAYSFVQNNILVSTTAGAQAATYFGCNAGQKITFTATKPIKGLLINGYVKQGFEAAADHGEIAYVDASEGEVEHDPVLAIFDVNSNSVTISCQKQLRCNTVEIYFNANPEADLEVEEEEEEEDEYSFDWEPTEVTEIDVDYSTANGGYATYTDYTDIAGFPYVDIIFTNDESDLELSAFCQSTPVTMVPVGTYEISDSGEDDTFEASPGGDDYYDYPSCYTTDYEEVEYEGETYLYYTTCYYLVSGTVTVAKDAAGVKVTVDAKTYNGSTFKATFVGCPAGDEGLVTGLGTVVASNGGNADGKRYHNGRITLRQGGCTYTTAGLRIR